MFSTIESRNVVRRSASLLGVQPALVGRDDERGAALREGDDARGRAAAASSVARGRGGRALRRGAHDGLAERLVGEERIELVEAAPDVRAGVDAPNQHDAPALA